MAKLLLAHDHFAYMGGGERMLLRVAGIAARLGSVRLALPLAKDCGVLEAQPERPLFADAQAFGLPHRMGLREMPAQWSAMEKLGRWIDADRPDAMVAFSLRSAIRLAPLAARRRIPFAWMCQQSFPLFLPPLAGLKQHLGVGALRRARTRIVCLSNEALAAFRALGFATGDLRLIRNGIDVEHHAEPMFLSRSRNETRASHSELSGAALVVACVARLDPLKNHAVVIRALGRLRREGLEAAAIFVGGEAPHAPGHAEDLRRLAASEGVGERILWAGEQSDPRPFVALADAAILPSFKEAQGLVLAEAGARGLPLLGSNVGGIPELVRDGKTGILFAPEDDIALARGIRQLATAPDLRARLGEGAREAVLAEYDSRRQDALWQSLLEELLARG